MSRRHTPYVGTPLVGVVLLFSAIFRATIFFGLLAYRGWPLAVIGIEALALLALAIGASKRMRWAKTLAVLYLVGSTFGLLALWFYSDIRSLALLDVLINLLLIWYVGAPETEQRTS